MYTLNGQTFDNERDYAAALHDRHEFLHRAVISGIRDADDGELQVVEQRLTELGYHVVQIG